MPEASERIRRRVLGFLDEKSPIQMTPNNIAQNIGYNSEYTGQACRELESEGYLHRLSDSGDPFYEITDQGRDYLAR